MAAVGTNHRLAAVVNSNPRQAVEAGRKGDLPKGWPSTQGERTSESCNAIHDKERQQEFFSANSAAAINQKDYTRGFLAKYSMHGCRPSGTPGYGKELSVMQPEDTSGRGGKSAISSYCQHRHVRGSGGTLRHLARGKQTDEGNVQSIQSAHGAANLLPRYLAGTVDFSITNKRRVRKTCSALYSRSCHFQQVLVVVSLGRHFNQVSIASANCSWSLTTIDT